MECNCGLRIVAESRTQTIVELQAYLLVNHVKVTHGVFRGSIHHVEENFTSLYVSQKGTSLKYELKP